MRHPPRQNQINKTASLKSSQKLLTPTQHQERNSRAPITYASYTFDVDGEFDVVRSVN